MCSEKHLHHFWGEGGGVAEFQWVHPFNLEKQNSTTLTKHL